MELGDLAAALTGGSWPAFFAAGLTICIVLGFLPGIVVRLASLMFPKGDPRRREMIAETYVQKWHERPLWAFEQIERGFTEGLPGRWRVRPRGLERFDRRAAKRSLDLLLAGVGVFVLAPMLLMITVIVRAGSPGPVLDRQPRIGRNGVPFNFYRFRTMRWNEDPDRVESHPTARNSLLPCPEVTPEGLVMRRYSVDEYPILFNVLRGEMSLVGPRPSLSELNHVSGSQKPGISGLWLVGQGGDAAEVSTREESYIRSWSLSRDLAIMVLTIRSVLIPVGSTRKLPSLRAATVVVRVLLYLTVAAIAVPLVVGFV